MLVPKCGKDRAVYRFYFYMLRTLQSAVNITAQFSYMMPYLANIMECADVCIALLQILSDGKAPCNELMLHHAMQCTGASCRMLQIPSNFDSMQLRDPSSKRPTYGTPILSHGAFTKTWFYTGICTYTCFCPGMVLHHAKVFLHRDAFKQKNIFTHTRGYFYTQTRGYLYTQMLLHSDAFTEECFYTGDTFNTEMLVHKGAIRYKYFYTEMMLLRETFRHRRVFTQVPLHRCFHTGVFTC